MNEFLKLNWGITDLSYLEKQADFIKEDILVKSLVYKHLEKPLNKNVKKTKKIFNNTALYVPGRKCFIQKTAQLSTLDTWQQEQCLKAMELIQSGRDLTNLKQSEALSLKIYKELQTKISCEHRRYFEFAQKCWNLRKEKLGNIKSDLFNFSKDKWLIQCRRFLDYSQYYKAMHTFNLVYEDNESTTIEFKCIQNLLELGELARFSQPSFKAACIMKGVNLPFIEEKPSLNSKKPVSKDENISKLLEMHNIDVVISFSSLKRLTDNADLKENWILPVIVKEISEHGKNIKKVVFIDNPFPQTEANRYYLAHTAFKYLLKTNLCQYEAFRFPTTETKLENEEEDPVIKNEENRKNNKIYHNVNYRLWKIKKFDNQNNLMKNKHKNVEINLLVRSKLAACENNGETLTPIIIKPKLERQLSFGANIPTQSELLREWISLFFTPYSLLYRARLQPLTGEVVALEKCSIQKVANEANVHYNCKPILSLGLLEKCFSELLKLDKGNYLLQHVSKDGAFVSILKEQDKSIKDCFDLHAEKEKCEIIHNIPYSWLPLDTNFILPAYKHFKRVPCLFKAFEKNKNKRKKFKKKNPNKTNNV